MRASLVSECVGACHREKARQNTSLRRDAMIPFKSELPPDMDSNQTLTASCRADVGARATFKPEGVERQEDRRQEHT